MKEKLAKIINNLITFILFLYVSAVITFILYLVYIN